MKPSLHSLATALLVALALLTLAARAADTPRASVLAGAVELEKPITLSETKIPLSELLQKVAAATGARLEVLPEVADEPVAVVVKEMPAREVLEQLADLLDYQWSRRGKEGDIRYEIHQDLAAKERETALRQAALADVEKRFQAELRSLLAMRALPPEQIERIMDEGEERQQKLRHLPVDQIRAANRSPEGREHHRRMRHAEMLASSIGRAMVTLLARLTPPQWAALRAGEPLQFADEPGPGEIALPADIVRTFRTSKPEVYPANRKAYPDHPGSEEELRQGEKRMQDQWSGATAYRVTVRLGPNAYQHKTGGSLELSMDAAPIRGGAPDGGHMGAHGPHLVLGAAPVEPRPAENTPRRAAELAKDPVLGARKPFKPLAKPDPIDPALNYRPSTKLQTVLPDLSRTYGVHFIADAYWNAPSVFLDQFGAAGPTPLYALLDRLAGTTHRWERQGALIRLRSHAWFFDRPREVPLRFVRRWRAITAERGAMPLEEYLTMATALTDEQLEGLAVVVTRDEGAWPGEWGSVHNARHALRLYHTLGAGQRQALWEGRTLPVAQMLPHQQEKFLAAVRDLSRFGAPPPHPSRWPDAGFALKQHRFVRIRERRGKSVTERVEPPAPASGEAESPSAPAAAAPHPAKDRPNAAAAGRRPPAPVVTRHPFVSLQFRFHITPGTERFTFVQVAPPS